MKRQLTCMIFLKPRMNLAIRDSITPGQRNQLVLIGCCLMPQPTSWVQCCIWQLPWQQERTLLSLFLQNVINISVRNSSGRQDLRTSTKGLMSSLWPRVSIPWAWPASFSCAISSASWALKMFEQEMETFHSLIKLLTLKLWL